MSDVKPPAVTVGIPAYNNERTLERAIDSVRSQTFPDWTLIISDDQSTDATWKIAEAAAQGDPRIRAVRQPKRRMFMNFADVLAQAETPYFVWLAGDDYWEPTFLAVCLGALTALPDAVTALPGHRFTTEVVRHPPPDLGGRRVTRIRNYLADPGGTDIYGLFRTEVLKRCFPRRNTFAYDWLLMLGVLNAGPQIRLPVELLVREKTHWTRYSEMVDNLYSSVVYRRFPILDMSLRAVAGRLVPLRALPALIRLNLRKHEEYLIVTRPQQFQRRRWLFRILGLPFASFAGARNGVAKALLERDDARRGDAAEMLRQDMLAGNGEAAMLLGMARRDGVVPGDPVECFAAAGKAGRPDGLFYAAELRLRRGLTGSNEAWEEVADAVRHGSTAAIDWVAAALDSGAVPEAAWDSIADALGTQGMRGRAKAHVALGRMLEAQKEARDDQTALAHYEAAARLDPQFAMLAGTRLAECGEPGRAAAWFLVAERHGVPEAIFERAACLATMGPMYDPEALLCLARAHVQVTDPGPRERIATELGRFSEQTCLAAAAAMLAGDFWSADAELDAIGARTALERRKIIGRGEHVGGRAVADLARSLWKADG